MDILKSIVQSYCVHLSFWTDLQMVNIGLRVLARPQATMLPDMYRKLGLDFDERVLPSIMNEVCTDYVCTMHKESFFFFQSPQV